MSDYTPGPLTINRFGEIVDSKGDQLLMSGVSLPCGNHPKVGEAKANSRLMAAAPELYEALKELHALVLGECPSLLNEDSGGDARLCMEIEDALKKARGKA